MHIERAMIGNSSPSVARAVILSRPLNLYCGVDDGVQEPEVNTGYNDKRKEYPAHPGSKSMVCCNSK